MRKILLGGTGVFLLFLTFLFSDNTMVGFSQFSALSGTEQISGFTFEITGGDTTGFTVFIYNKELVSMQYKLGFVDGFVTDDGFNHKTCLSEHENQEVGQYITGDTSLFTLTTESSLNRNLSVTFPTYYSGRYHGCVTLYPSTIDGASGMNTLPRRGVFVDALVHPSSFPVIVKAFPSNRVYQNINKSNIGIIKVYDASKALISTSPLFTLNSEGTGEALINVPAGTYYVAFKGQSHLASYLSGVVLGGTGGEFLDFTTGTDLYYTQQLNDAQDDGNRYQSAGDLKNVLGVYDHMVNGNDIAIVTAVGLVEGGIAVLDPRNLNGDGSVNASDISVIGVNFEKTDPFFDGIFTW